jgi:hypothetical protein
MQYRVKSQLYSDAEAQQKGAKQILDDCTWSSCAAAVSWASGYTVDYSAAQGVAAMKKVTGRKDIQGKSDNGGSLAEAAKVIAHLGGKARYAKSWEDAVAAAKGGAALQIWVQQGPAFYPTGVKISAWHDRWFKWWSKKDAAHLKAGYGHMTSAGWCEDHGWQWACPTRDEKVAAEKYGVPVTEAQLRQIANSKFKAGKAGVDYKCILIVTHPGKAAAPAPVAAPTVAPVVAPVVVPVVAPVAPTINVEAPRKPVEAKKVESGTKTPSELDVAVKALEKVDWASIGAKGLALAGSAAEAAKKEKTIMGKIGAWFKYIVDNSKIDEMLLDAVRTFLTVSISVALGLGIPLLDINGGDFRTIISAGLASALQIVVKALDPSSTDYGVQKKK